MPTIDQAIDDFLAQKRIAVAGVSREPGGKHGGNIVYQRLKERGYEVFAVNPNAETVEGDPCYPDLKLIPETPDAVFILANPQVTEQIVQQCGDLGIKRVWMHCMMGTKPGLASGMTSVSQAAVRNCSENGIMVIHGACPNQFLNADFGHALMRKMFRALKISLAKHFPLSVDKW